MNHGAMFIKISDIVPGDIIKIQWAKGSDGHQMPSDKFNDFVVISKSLPHTDNPLYEQSFVTSMNVMKLTDQSLIMIDYVTENNDEYTINDHLEECSSLQCEIESIWIVWIVEIKIRINESMFSPYHASNRVL